MAKTALFLLVLAIFCFARGQSASVTVLVGANSQNIFQPSAVTLNVGDTISFQYVSGFHTVNSAANSAAAAAGTPGTALGVTFSVSPCNTAACSFTTSPFNTAGTAAFFCQIHFASGMVGSITVNGAAASSVAAASSPAGVSSHAAAASSPAGVTSPAAAASSVAAAGSSAAAAGSSAAAAGSSAAAAGSSAAAVGSSPVAATSLVISISCGDGIVESGEQCDFGSSSKRIWEQNCCIKRTCRFIPANVICGSVSRSRYLANYCFSTRTETCNGSGQCLPHFLAIGTACRTTAGKTGKCTASGSIVTCV